MTIINRSVFKAAVLMCAGASFCSSAASLVLSHGYPPKHDIVAHGIQPWMKCVKDATGPALDFKYFPSGQIASAKDSLDAVNSGLAQISTAPIGYLSDKMPLSGISMLPNMGNTSLESVNAFRSMLDGQNPMAKEFEKNRVVPILVNMLPAYQLISKDAPIDSLDKFEGKVFRSAGGTMTIAIGALQGAPAEMNGGDVYVAMQRGTLDAMVASLSSIKPYSMQELVKSISGNANFGTFPTILIMDRQAFDKLDVKVQTAVLDCGRKAEQDLANYLDFQTDELKKEFARDGIEIFNISKENLQAINGKLNGVAENYVMRLEKRGYPAREVFLEYQQKLKTAHQLSVAD